MTHVGDKGRWYNDAMRNQHQHNTTLFNGKNPTDTVRITDTINVFGGTQYGGMSTSGAIAGGLFNLGASIFGAWAQSKMMMSAEAQGQLDEQTLAAATATSGIINNYVMADANLDEAKRNMQTAMKQLEGLEADLTKAENAGEDETVDGSKKNIQGKLDNLNGIAQANGTNAESIKAFEDAKKKYETAVSSEKSYSKLKQDNTGLEQKMTDLVSSKKIDTTGKAVAVNGSVTTTSGTTVNLTGGNAVNSLNSYRNAENFYVEPVKDNQKVFSPNSFNAALATAQELDTKFEENKQAAKEYSDAKTQFEKNNLEMDRLKSLCGEEPTAAYVERCKADMDQKGDFNVGGKTELSAKSYVSQRDEYKSQMSELNKLSTPENIKSLKASIEAKKKEISGTLTTKLNTAQGAFDTAAVKFDEIKQSAAKMATASDSLQEYQDAAKASKKKKKGGIANPANWFRKKTADQKAYKQQRTAFQQQSNEYLTSYGGDYKEVQTVVQRAEAEVKRVDIKLDDKWKNIH